MITDCRMLTGWDTAFWLATATQGKPTKNYPAPSWIRKMIKAEHSPIRGVMYMWTWENMPYWVSVHISRHKVGIEHYVSTQRSDRTGKPREDKRQDTPVMHTCIANVQALLTVSRKRLCGKASLETRHAWQMLVDAITAVDPILGVELLPDCEYRGKCHEMQPCGRPGMVLTGSSVIGGPV